MTSEERPSVLERLERYKTQLDQQQKSAPTRERELKKAKTTGLNKDNIMISLSFTTKLAVFV